MVDSLVRAKVLQTHPPELRDCLARFRRLCADALGFASDLRKTSSLRYEALSPLEFLERVGLDVSDFHKLQTSLRDRRLYRQIKQLAVHCDPAVADERGCPGSAEPKQYGILRGRKGESARVAGEDSAQGRSFAAKQSFSNAVK